jgi:hypothetical protein
VERWFGELSRQCIRRGAFFSIEDLQKAKPGASRRLERKSQTFCLDGYGGIDHGKAVALSANVGEDSTRMHFATEQKEEQ